MILTLCGSARFEPWFHAWNEALSLAGHVIFGLAAYPSQHGGKKSWYTSEQKLVLDAVHRAKIETSHAILVLNAFAYLGESTLSEISYARTQRKKTYFLESWGEGCGLSLHHFESVRRAAACLDIPFPYGSPIDTTACSSQPDPWSLLGPAGTARSALVERLHESLSIHEGRSHP